MRPGAIQGPQKQADKGKTVQDTWHRIPSRTIVDSARGCNVRSSISNEEQSENRNDWRTCHIHELSGPRRGRCSRVQSGEHLSVVSVDIKDGKHPDTTHRHG